MQSINTSSTEFSTAATASALRGPCIAMHTAVCAEAVRAIFALRFLSRTGIDHLTQQLQRCRLAADRTPGSTLAFSKPPATVEAEEEESNEDYDAGVNYLVEKYASRTPYIGGNPPPLPFSVAASSSPPCDRSPPSVNLKKEVSFATPAAARSCLERVSLMSLCTAAHLLRCSAWTAALLAAPADFSKKDGEALPNEYAAADDDDATHAAGSTTLSTALLRQARELETLRTQEPGWCATVLVRITEWLLQYDVSGNVHGWLAHALSLTEYERRDCCPPPATRVPRIPPFHRSKPPSQLLLSPADNDTRYSEAQQSLGVEEVVVQDSLPLFFPWLRTQRGASTDTSVCFGIRCSSYNWCGCCCEHRWFLEDLPRWCRQVAVDRQAASWFRHHVLRDAVARWRMRHGLRVVTLLSQAAAHHGGADATPGDTFVDTAERRLASTPTSLKHHSEALKLTSPAATKRCVAACQTAEEVSLPVITLPVGDTEAKATCAPPSPCSNVSHTAASETYEAVQHVHTASPSALILDDAEQMQAARMNTAYEVSLLDRLLQRGSGEHAALNDNVCGADGNPSCKGDAAQPHHANPKSRTGEEAKAFPATTAFISAPPLRSMRAEEDVVLSNNEEDEAQAKTPEWSAEDEALREAQLISQIEEQRNRVTVRGAFLFWRNRRLYESMATRYVHSRQTSRAMRQSWRLWKRRCTTAVQRRKEARDDALGTMVTEQKAIGYFRRLLQVWRRAALVRKSLIRTLGSHVVRVWRCRTLLLQHRRATQQPYVGALRTKREVWQRWCDQRLRVAADRHSARHLLLRTLMVMRVRCNERADLRTAAEVHNHAVTTLVWQTWKQRLSRADQLRVSAKSVKYERRQRECIWRRWRARLLQRQRSRRHAADVDRLCSQRALQHCFQTWVFRFQLESRVRSYTVRRQRSALLRPAFERWRSRAEVCTVVRCGQEELAWKVGEHLQCRKVLRVWYRRAAVHAETRKAARAVAIEDVADRLARLNRLARTFFHWRTRGLLLRRYQIDRRRCLPEAQRGKPLQIQGSSPSPPPPPPLTERVSKGATDGGTGGGAAQETSMRAGRSTTLANMTPLPPPPSSTCSATASVLPSSSPSQNHSARVSPRQRGRQTTSWSPQHRRVHTTNSNARDELVQGNRGAVEQHQGTAKERIVEGVGFAKSTPPVSFTAAAPTKTRGTAVVHVGGAAAPPWRRALALERQLFRVQCHTSLSTFGVCFLSKTAGQCLPPTTAPHHPSLNSVKEALSQPVNTSVRYSTRPSPRHEATQPPLPYRVLPSGSVTRNYHRSNSSRSNSSSSSGNSATDRQMPIRLHTGTPLFRRRKTHDSSPRDPSRVSHLASDLVESPPQHLSRQLRTTREGESYQEDAATPAFVSRKSANRLLSQMELLLQRVRGIEAAYRSSSAAPTGKA